MNVPRAAFQMLVLPDCSALAAGGQNDKAVFQTSAELYDPFKDEWTLTGSMSTPHVYFEMAY
jgi:hypothetical protein